VMGLRSTIRILRSPPALRRSRVSPQR